MASDAKDSSEKHAQADIMTIIIMTIVMMISMTMTASLHVRLFVGQGASYTVRTVNRPAT